MAGLVGKAILHYKIVEQIGAKRREFYLKNRPEIKRIMDEGFLQIKKELNNDQQKKLDVLREEFEKRSKARYSSRELYSCPIGRRRSGKPGTHPKGGTPSEARRKDCSPSGTI